MLDELVRYSYFDTHSPLLDDFEEILIRKNFHHYASQLLKRGVDNETELEKAIDKAIAVCLVAGLKVDNHFKPIFVYTGSEIKKDWLLSYLGLRLIIMNCEVSNSVMACLQIQVLSARLS